MKTLAIILSLILMSMISETFSESITNKNEQTLDLTLLPIEEVDYQFSGISAISVNQLTGATTVNNYHADGKITSLREDKKLEGFWYTDFEGNHCIKWSKKAKPNCGVIMKDEDGNWVRVKNDEIERRYTEFRKLPKEMKK